MTKKILKIISTIALIFIVLIQTMGISIAAVNSDIKVITENSEKEKLLGIENEEEKKTSLLGIAEKFSIFAKENVTLKAADTNGRIAVGGKLEATTEYEYQVACEVDGYKESEAAQIISENGPIKNIAVDFGYNNEKQRTYNISKQVAISSNFDFNSSRKSKYDTIWYYDKYYGDNSYIIDAQYKEKDNIYSTSQFKEANLFKFEDEFKYLEEQSKKIVELYSIEEFKSEEISEGKIIIDSAGTTLSSIIFKGNNKRLNVFNLASDEFNTLLKGTGTKRALTFDVPYGSYVIINITGEEQVNFDGSELSVYYPMSNLEKDNYSQDSEDIAYIENEEIVFHRISGGNNNDISIENNANQAQYILYNIPNASNFTISSNWIGTILAPKSNGTDTGLNGTEECGGHLSGMLVCNSYEGYEQFGYVPFSLGLIEIDIEKIEGDNKTTLPGAEMAIYYFETDENGKIICNDDNLAYKWITTDEIENIILPSGGYVLKEINPPTGYDRQDDKYYIFETENVINYEGKGKEYGSISYESVVKETYEETKETAVNSTANSIWRPILKLAYMAVDILTNINA